MKMKRRRKVLSGFASLAGPALASACRKAPNKIAGPHYPLWVFAPCRRSSATGTLDARMDICVRYSTRNANRLRFPALNGTIAYAGIYAASGKRAGATFTEFHSRSLLPAPASCFPRRPPNQLVFVDVETPWNAQGHVRADLGDRYQSRLTRSDQSAEIGLTVMRADLIETV